MYASKEVAQLCLVDNGAPAGSRRLTRDVESCPRCGTWHIVPVPVLVQSAAQPARRSVSDRPGVGRIIRAAGLGDTLSRVEQLAVPQHDVDMLVGLLLTMATYLQTVAALPPPARPSHRPVVSSPGRSL